MGVKFDVMNLGNVGLLNPEQMGYRDSVDIIKDESIKVQKSFVKIGWYLKHIRDDKLYQEDGYANIYECAADLFGYSQSSVSRFINICEKFSKDHNSPELDTQYAGFDKSQMIEMLPLSPDELGKVTPDMTVAQIRDIKSVHKLKNSEPQPEEADVPGQTSIENDFPEYMPSSAISKSVDSEKEKYATSHIEADDTYGLEDDSEGIADQANTDVKQELLSPLDYAKSEYPEGSLISTEESDLLNTKPDDPAGQPELPNLKNNDQRKEWLVNYKSWGLWYTDSNIDVNYYKYDFPDGSRLIVAEYPQRDLYWKKAQKDEVFYHLLEKNKKGYSYTYDEKYRHKEDSETYLVEFLKNLQKKG